MNVAARTEVAAAPSPAAGEGGASAQIVLFDALDPAEPLWRRLEADDPLASPYQRFEWIGHWFEHVGRPQGNTPLIAAGVAGTGDPLFVIPFASRRQHGCHVVGFCGGNHSNLNLPIWRRGAPPCPGILAEIAGRCGVDLFALMGQPREWQGVPNPFAALPHQRCPDDVYCGTLAPDGPAFVPRLPTGMRKKERRLMRLDGVRYVMAASPTEAERIIAAFHIQKAARFARQGIHNVFADPGVAAFIRAACLDGLAERHPAIELHALYAGGEIVAVVGGACNPQRFSVMFNSITDSERSRLSPGIVLMSHIIADCARRGVRSFDLGAGHAAYKSYFCSGSERRFDCFVPFSARGRALALACRAGTALRYSIKHNPAVMNALQAMRRWTNAGGAGGS